MDKRYLLELIRKFDRGEATPEEEELLKSYYNLSGNEPDGLSDLPAAQKALLREEIFSGIPEQVSLPATPVARKRISRMIAGIAAAASVLLLCTAALYFLNHGTGQPKRRLADTSMKRENRLVYLPDGSKVIVSWGSQLTCSPSFGAAKREVTLSGQAYFDIAHDAAKPFIVHTGQLSTIVLGTAFNIKAIPGEEDITVTVTRGKVRIADEHKELGLITPGKQIIYYRKAGSSVQRTVDRNMHFDWKERDLLVNNVTVEEAARLLEEKFGVSISVNDPQIRNERFTTVFLQQEDLEPILKSICAFNNAEYEYDRAANTVTIRKPAGSPEK